VSHVCLLSASASQRYARCLENVKFSNPPFTPALGTIGDMLRRNRPASPAATRSKDWRSYDAVAETYNRVRSPVHEGPARDLVDALAPPQGGRVLDVGTGPGVAAVAASQSVGSDGIVVGIDPSEEMLRLGRGRGLSRLAAAEAIDLPFRDGTFDAVLANFVIFFFTKYDTALFDMARVLKPGGRLGVTTWAGRGDEFTRAWRLVAESFATKEMLDDAARKAVPWEERLSDPGHLQEALRDAGLRGVEVGRREYRTTMSVADYLAGRETSAVGRFLRDMLGEKLWPRFQARVEEEFRSRFDDPIGDSNDVLIAVGTRP
jgi:ubiquinone/menaquinone biosynthesis C-methylase UbiE